MRRHWLLNGVLAVAATSLSGGCTVVRAPDTIVTPDWSRPVLPALIQPEDYHRSDLGDRAPAPREPGLVEPSILARPVALRRFDLVAEGVACGDVFSELAQHASMSLSVQVPLEKRVWLTLAKRPLDELLSLVARQCACRAHAVRDRIEILPDTPYLHSYSLDYLNIQRGFDTVMNVDTRVGAPGDDATSGAASSSARLETSLVSDPWGNLMQAIKMIVESIEQSEAALVTAQREAGLITVSARQTTHRAVQDYLDKVVSRLQRQVLIEASVIEVALDERHASGVDWLRMAELDGLSWVQSLGSRISAGDAAGGAVLQFTSKNGSHSTTAAVKLLQQFGDVRVVSSPRIVALNNQPSVLKVVDNTVYFSLDIDRELDRDSGVESQSVKTTIHTVPVGLIMHVTPQISASGAVSMNIRPSISRIVRYALDPNPSLADAGVRNEVPEIQVRELETTLRVKSGSTVALGGLRQLTDGSNRDAVPGLERLPLLGNLFRSRDASKQQVELLILLTPHVLPVEGMV